MEVSLLAIVGQTAAGKSSLALALARHLPLEIISADSKTIYRGLDIGTAKPSVADQALVPHHLLDLAKPGEAFNVVRFQKAARQAIEDIHRRRRLPVLVGGSGLYVDSVLLDYRFAAAGHQAERARRQSLSISELQTEIKDRGLPMPDNAANRRYLVRTLERGPTVVSRSDGWDEHILVVGLKLSRWRLESRIRERLKEMLGAGLLEEARGVFDNYPSESEASKSNIYAALKPYFEGRSDLKSALEDFVRRDLALAKKQLTWFKRHPQIQWFEDSRQAELYLRRKLIKKEA